MKIERFEDITSWQKARELTRHIYRHSKTGEFARDFGLRDQIREASVSIMSNIAEGFERGGDKEFRQFLSTAKGSCGEVRSQLYVALDQNYIVPADFDLMYQMATEISRLTTGFMRYLAGSELRGHKYK
jgi:four helix bundle protein